ncbi:NAD(P)-dependent oxidoreductase [Bacteriovorax sp. BAL6_X]|uniref:NAD-dependent epimerase/dehydratase family protein n=1 Tax=Bacteriovorax sp. BAL6_X TaxID=1201290 RepID=UPI0004078D49|nr:NAD-dependent epimerase/dehydratase family protein [Bacteriovorax sp. BAL6_X]
MTRPKMLVSGGLGFLGSEIAKNFFQEYAITIIDNLSTNVVSIDDLKDICGEITYRNMDLAKLSKVDLDWLNTELNDTTIFCHFAAAVGVKKIDQSPREAIINENKINHDLLPLLAKYKTKTIFASSSEVYGNQENCVEDQSLQIGPPDILRWGYACNKLMTEFLLKSYEIPHITLRLFNVTGPRQSSKYGMVIPKMIRDAIKTGKITIYGDGTQTRSFCHISDLIGSLKYLIEQDKFTNQTINIGNDQNRVTIEELAHLIKDTLKLDVEIEKIAFNDEYSANSKDILKRSPSIEKLKQFYRPQVKLKAIIEDIAKSYE